jgi:putative membrane protein
MPALAAVFALALTSAVSLAVAGGGHREHHGSHGHGHGGWQSHGHHGCSWKHVSGLDERWLTVHIQTNLFEISGGRAAEPKATTPEVRELAAELVRDHTAALEQAKAVAGKVGVAIPNRPAPLQEWSLRAVQQFGGADFDRWFADLQVEGHKQAIVEASFEAARGCNRKVRGLAAASLPVLQAHLEHAQSVLGAVSD